MMSATRLRAAYRLPQQLRLAQRSFATTGRQLEQQSTTVPAESNSPRNPDNAPGAAVADPAAQPPAHIDQAPNRAGIWARSQQPRDKAMTGPRFEQTDFSLQPQPWSAMELVHKQPVRWTHDRIVACDGGGGPAGHPRIFINTDKPEIATCGYCGLPFANEHHRKHLESLPQTSYPLS
ncbi:uncharacterized protein E0L32_005540 [Thyridium curvatum]|uniref:Zinc finger CHCC-type domain-containing protein n=1 Tax=Thyridium curvatum TaxID=1093900 RepID=A0A507B6R0_9PEZI|nr:uncharacterized protein E0L32_005540 [Thyridium curvatum]TPX14344.1 hypothetical protein E0L32_005540 [Thyridium curvatum]